MPFHVVAGGAGGHVLRKRVVVAGLALAILAVVGFLLWRGRPTAPASGARAPAAGDVGVNGAPAELSARPLPPAQGELTLRGEVRGPGGPVAGAIVTATTARGEDVLSELRCHCGNDCGQKLLECGCSEAAGQLTELVGARKGETPPVARATTDGEGRFVLVGLAEGSYAVWAESAAGSAVVPGVRAGAESLLLEVDGGVSLAGKVVGEDGKGVGRAVVTAIYAKHSRFFDALAGADGAFSFGPLPPGPYTVVASAPGLLPGRARVESGSRVDLRLELVAPRALAGRVTEDGAPAAGATVTLQGEHKRLEARAGDDGSFTLRALRPGEYQLLGRLGDRVAQLAVAIPKGRDVRDVPLALGAGVFVDGVVVDGAGAPIDGARVDAGQVAPRRRARIGTTLSDPSGRFRLGPFEPGELELSAKLDGYLMHETVKVAALATTSARVVLRRAQRIEGRVADTRGAPVSGAHVWAERSGGSDEEGGGSAISREDGTFTLEVRDGSFEVGARHEAFRSSPRRTVRAPSSGLVLTLDPGAAVEGDLRDEEGRPVAEAIVQLTAASRSREGDFRGVHVQTDARGRFRMSGLDPGEGLLNARRTARSDEEPSSGSASARVQVPASGTVRVRLRFEAGLVLSGTVVGEDGAGLAGVRVAAWGASGQSLTMEEQDDVAASYEAASSGYAVTAASGRFTIRGLKAGEHLVVVRKDGFDAPAKPPRVQAGDGDVRIVLAKGGFVRGRVVGVGGEPVAARVEVSGGVTFRRLEAAQAGDPDGRLAVPIHADGALSLRIHADGYAPLDRIVEVRRGVDVDLGDLVLGRGRALSGLVVDADTGAPVVAAHVWAASGPDAGLAAPLRSESTAVALSGADGTFVVRNLPDSALLRIEKDGYAPATVTAGSGPEPLRVSLGRGGVVAVRVLSASGEPMTRLDLMVYAAGQRPALGKTDAEGRFEAKALAAGTYVVHVQTERPNPGLVGTKVEVRDGERVSVELRERLSGTTLVVTLGGAGLAEGEPFHVALVRGDVPPVTSARRLSEIGVPLEPIPNQPPRTQTFQHLDAGRYTLLVLKPDGDEIRLLTLPLDVAQGPRQAVEVTVPAELPRVTW